MSLSALQLLNFLLPFITLPYLARVIGVEKFGILAFAGAVVIFFQTFTDYGFNYTAVRDIAKNKEDNNTVSKIFCSVMFIRFLFATVGFLGLLLLMNLIPDLKEHKLVLILTFLSIPGYIMFPEWFFQAMERMKYITIINVVSKTFFTSLIFLFINEEKDYILVPLLTALGYFFSGIIAQFYIFKRFQVNLVLPSFKEILETIKGSTNMFLSLIFPNLYTNFSTIFLTKFGGQAAAGIFSSGFKFIEISQRLTNVLSRTFYPFLARRMDKHQLYLLISFILSLVMAAALYFGADVVISTFLTSEFKDAVIILKIMSISPIFLFLMNAYGTNHLVLINKEKTLRNIIIFCSVIGLLLSYSLIQRFSYIGAAIAIVSVWGLRGFLTFYVSIKIKRNNLSVKLAQQKN